MSATAATGGSWRRWRRINCSSACWTPSPIPLTSTPAYLLFRAKEQSGQQYFKFCCEIRKVIPDEPFQAVEMSFPISMEIGHKRTFSRVTPPQSSIRLLSLWTITPQQPMPLTLEQVGPPVLAAKRGAAAPAALPGGHLRLGHGHRLPAGTQGCGSPR